MIDILYGVVKLFSSINSFLIFREKMFDFRRVLLLSLLFIKYDYVEISMLIPGVAGLITSPLLTYPYNLVSFPQQFPGSLIYIYIYIYIYRYSWHGWREVVPIYTPGIDGERQCENCIFCLKHITMAQAGLVLGPVALFIERFNCGLWRCILDEEFWSSLNCGLFISTVKECYSC